MFLWPIIKVVQLIQTGIHHSNVTRQINTHNNSVVWHLEETLQVEIILNINSVQWMILFKC